jgi:hypothetical protein
MMFRASTGKRCEPRKPIEVSVRIFGTDRDGKIFSEGATSADLSHHGARLKGVKTQLKADEVIGVTYGRNKGHFRVKWTGAPGTPAEVQIGLLNLSPEKQLWDMPLPHGEVDGFQSTAANDRRKWPRVKCSISVELQPAGQTIIRGRASDLSQGGCFVEMASPLPPETKLEIMIWLGGAKVRLEGAVASASPGFGIGVRFANVSPTDQEFLQKYIKATT